MLVLELGFTVLVLELGFTVLVLELGVTVFVLELGLLVAELWTGGSTVLDESGVLGVESAGSGVTVLGSDELVGSGSAALEPVAVVSLLDEGSGEDCGSDDEPCNGVDKAELLDCSPALSAGLLEFIGETS